MWVEPEVLRDGANVSRSAGEIVGSGADALNKTEISRGIFGDFEEAHAFHGTLNDGRQSHVRAMRGNRSTLNGVGDKAQWSAALFETTEANNKSHIDAVWDA